MNRKDLITEMRGLREQVPGVTGTLVAASDGLVVAADIDDDTDSDVDADYLAAVAAANLGIARQVVGVTRQGTFGQAITHASRGHVAVYAVGTVALLVVLGDEGLDVGMLQEQSQPTLGRIHNILTSN